MEDNPAEQGEIADLDDVYKGAPRGDAACHLSTESLMAGLDALAAPPKGEGRLELLCARGDDHSRSLPQRARLTPEGGLQGDRWTEASCKYGVDGQLTVMRADVGRLIANGQDLGLFGDNLLVDLDLTADNLPAGTGLRVGGCVLVVTPAPHNGCKKYRARFGLDALKVIGHRSRRDSRLRGIYVRVLKAGEVAVGDRIEVLRPRTPQKHPFAELLGLQFSTLEAGRSVCALEVAGELMNPQGVVHGAALYALADTGMGGALYPTLGGGELCATIEIKITYFHPVRSGPVECETALTHRGSRVAALESVIHAEGKVVASASGSYSIFRPRS